MLDYQRVPYFYIVTGFWTLLCAVSTDVVTTYYHSWGFLVVTLGRCQPLFQELLLLLQPLSVLPFDLNLVLEPQLQRHRQLRSMDRDAFPPQPGSALLSSWPKLQADRRAENSYNRQSLSCYKEQRGDVCGCRSPISAPASEFVPHELDPVDIGASSANFRQNHTDTWFQISMDGMEDETKKHCGTQIPVTPVQAESSCQSSLRWARLFGAASTRAEQSSGAQDGR